MGHYALPLLWNEEIRGWANLRVENNKGRLHCETGFIDGRKPKGAAFKLALEEELERIGLFLGI